MFVTAYWPDGARRLDEEEDEASELLLLDEDDPSDDAELDEPDGSDELDELASLGSDDRDDDPSLAADDDEELALVSVLIWEEKLELLEADERLVPLEMDEVLDDCSGSGGVPGRPSSPPLSPRGSGAHGAQQLPPCGG